MIPLHEADVFDRSLKILNRFGNENKVRGRFVALYLGLRRMGDQIAPLGSPQTTPPGRLETFLDDLFLKTHVSAPLNVLTALFVERTSPNSPWSAKTGQRAPGNRYPTNTWRNSFNIYNGVGCHAAADTIGTLLKDPYTRLSCPHLSLNEDDLQACAITGSTYSVVKEKIWLRSVEERGFQVIDLNDRSAFRDYLRPSGRKIPIFPLIGVLYSFAQSHVYPDRSEVGIPEFAQDFMFSMDQVYEMFDADPEGPWNRELLMSINGQVAIPIPNVTARILPTAPTPAFLNTGLGAELAVARDLQSQGWNVDYVANVRSLGYDLQASRGNQVLRVEIKSSVGMCTPELTEHEWQAAQGYGEGYILAVVDCYGSAGQTILYIRNPAASMPAAEKKSFSYRFSRVDVIPFGDKKACKGIGVV